MRSNQLPRHDFICTSPQEPYTQEYHLSLWSFLDSIFVLYRNLSLSSNLGHQIPSSLVLYLCAICSWSECTLGILLYMRWKTSSNLQRICDASLYEILSLLQITSPSPGKGFPYLKTHTACSLWNYMYKLVRVELLFWIKGQI